MQLLAYNERLASNKNCHVCFDMAAVGSCTVAHFEKTEDGELLLFQVKYGISFRCELIHEEQRVKDFDLKMQLLVLSMLYMVF